MATNRRNFLKTTAAAGGALAAGMGVAAALPGRAAASRPQATNPLRILILGGTNFIGPHQVEYALSRGPRGHPLQPGPHQRAPSSPIWRSWWGTGTTTSRPWRGATGTW